MSASRQQLPSSYNSNSGSKWTRTSSNTFGTGSSSTQVSKHGGGGGGGYLKSKLFGFGGSSGGFHTPSSPAGGPILIGTNGYGNGLAAGFGGTEGYLADENSRSGWLSPGSNISMQDHHNSNTPNAVDRDLEAQGLDTVAGKRKG